MSNSEAFVEALVAHKVTDVFGIVGSAFMDALDLFPQAGIRFISVQHEQNSAHMADGFARISGRTGVVIGQNGPGVSNSVTGVAAAYWAHTPLVMITPEAASMGVGLGGFQELDTLRCFEAVVKHQCHVNNPNRIVEKTEQAFNYARLLNGPTQLNIPRDYFYGDGVYTVRGPQVPKHGAGSAEDLAAVARLLAEAQRPVLISGGGVVLAGAVDDAGALASAWGMPAVSTYLHNDSMRASHECFLGPIGYLGSKGAMQALSEADLVLAVGCRLNPFGTNPQYGFDYWPKQAKLVQVDCDAKRLGLTRHADVAVCADAGEFLRALNQLAKPAFGADAKAQKLAGIAATRQAWLRERDAMTADETSTIHVPRDGAMKPRQVLAELQKAMPRDAVVATDIGNTCSVANGYLDFEHPRHFLGPMTFGNCGYASPAVMGAKVARPELPCVAYCGEGAWGMQLMETLTCVREKIPITVCVFNNGQWGAEMKNQILWFGDRYVGTPLENPSFAQIAKSMGAEGIKVEKIADVQPALKEAIRLQMEEGKTCIIEFMNSRELGDPFRRDAMKLPVRLLDKYQHLSVKAESPTQQRTEARPSGEPVLGA